MAPPLGHLAAANNAAWCDAMCRAHGGPTRFEPGLWCHLRPSPPFFPNVVTLQPGLAAATLARALQPLLQAPAENGSPPLGVKDSFADLDLAPLGFQVLFEARWLWRPAGAAPGPDGGWQWSAVRTPAALAAWEAAWWARAEPGTAPVPLFPPALLAEPGLTLLAGERRGRVCAGAVLMARGGVLGLSCCFGDDPAVLMPALVAEAARRHPALPQVGYDQAADLPPMQACGFEDAGPLRVWLRGAAPS